MKSPNFRKKSEKHIDKPIAIIGHMGSGKTLIGKLKTAIVLLNTQKKFFVSIQKVIIRFWYQMVNL